MNVIKEKRNGQDAVYCSQFCWENRIDVDQSTIDEGAKLSYIIDSDIHSVRREREREREVHNSLFFFSAFQSPINILSISTRNLSSYDINFNWPFHVVPQYSTSKKKVVMMQQL